MNRLRFVNEAPVLLEEIWLPKGKFEQLLKIETIAFGNLLYPMYESHCGQIISSAEETLTADIARGDDAKMLRIAEGAPVIVIERVAFDFRARSDRIGEFLAGRPTCIAITSKFVEKAKQRQQKQKQKEQ